MLVSIIVCTRNRVKDLEGCIRAIWVALQMAPAAKATLIVVDNGSTDGTGAELIRLSSVLGLSILIVQEERPGLSRARNAGLRKVKKGLVIFLDDDCHMDPDYVKIAMKKDARDGNVLTLRGGRVLLGDPDDLPFTIKTSEVAARWCKAKHDASEYNLGNSLLGANLSFRKELVQQVGLFDERLGAGTSIPGGEDTDFIFRCYIAGADIVYDPELIVHHFHGRKEASEAWSLLKNYSLGGGALVAKYLFVSPVLIKQFRWDIKDALKEAHKQMKGFHPEVEFHFRDKLSWQLRGIVRFTILWLLRKPGVPT